MRISSCESLFSLSMSGLRPGGFVFDAGRRAIESSSPLEYRVTFGGLDFSMLSRALPLTSS